MDAFDHGKRADLIRELVATGGVPVDIRMGAHKLTAFMKSGKNANVDSFAACMRMGADLLATDSEGRNVRASEGILRASTRLL